MNDKRKLAERLAALTEQVISRQDSPDEPSHSDLSPGLASLEKIIRAYSGLHRPREAGQERPIQFRWGHLEVLEKLGSGSYGEVYCAFDKVLDREVALKLRSSNETSAWAYIDEARSLARVRHSHVLAVHGAAVHDSRVGLWSDLIDGCTLSEWVAVKGARPREELLASAIMLASALEAVHRAGLIHGDVKPGNIMRDASGQMVLMDFGTAVENVSGGVRTYMGSPLAMAPEQLDGSRITAAVDVYALGVVLYVLATGRYPLQVDSLQALSIAHARKERPDFGLLIPRCGRLLASLIERMMAIDPALRPNASEIVRLLLAIELAPARRRKRMTVAGIVSALVIALAVSLVALVRVSAERNAKEVAIAREASVRNFMREFLASPKPRAGGADARVIDVLIDAVPVAEERFASEPLALAEVIGDIGFSFSSIGAYAQANPLLERAERLGREHGMAEEQLLPLKIRFAENIAYAAGSKAESAPLQALLDQSRKTLGAGHETTLQAALALGLVQDDRSETSASEATFAYVLAQRPLPNQAADSQRLLAQNNLASLYCEQQRWTEAESILEEALTVVRESGAENGSTGIALRLNEERLARLRGQFARAETLSRTLLQDIEKTYGPRHRNLRVALNDLAINQRMQGKAIEAVASLRRAIELGILQLGEEHPEVMILRDNLASALSDSGDRDAARQLREELLATKSKIQGASHPDTLLSAINLAEQLVEDGDAKRGIDLARDSADKAAQVFSAGHLYTLEAREIAARGLIELGQLDAARDELVNVHDLKRGSIGEDHIYTLRSAGFLADALARNGEKRSARALLESAIASLLENFGDDQPDLRRMREQLAKLDSAATPRP